MSVAEVVWPGGDLTAPSADWLWVHAPQARPLRDAVDVLLAAAGELDDEPVLLAALVVDADGLPRADRLPAGREADTAAAIAAVGRRMLPVRSAPFAAILLRTDAVREHGLPDVAAYGPHAPQVWTASVLSGEKGYLVPSAVVVETETQPPAALRPTLRAARSDVWTRGEQVRALLHSRPGRR